VSKYSQCQINNANQQIFVQITEAQRENSHNPATTPHAVNSKAGTTHEAGRGPRTDHCTQSDCVRKPRSRLPTENGQEPLFVIMKRPFSARRMRPENNIGNS
jgi:hypothetical protein